MGHVNLSQGISNFFTIFNTFVDILKDTTFTVGMVNFSLWELMWSLLFISLAINFIKRLLEGD